jgi:hypothetical protein
MTAIGFFMFAASLSIILTFEYDDLPQWLGMSVAAIFVVGFFILAAGVSVKLWEVMP